MNAQLRATGSGSRASGQVTTPASGFTELVCNDPELLRREFDELIAASWDGPPPNRPPDRCPPQRPEPLHHARRRHDPGVSPPARHAGITKAPARERGPPPVRNH